jgi:uncharacterized protein (TIGR03437 family)
MKAKHSFLIKAFGIGHGSCSFEVMSSLIRAALLLSVTLGLAPAQSTCITFPITFPAQFVPFASIYYVTAANAAGDHLVVGALAGGPSGLGAIANIPLPSVLNQTFCDAQVQLAPGQLYPNVYVPTAAERAGMFSAFAGLLVDPASNQPYSGGVIPATILGSVYAWRIGPAQVAQAVRGWNPTGSMTEPRTGQAAVLLPGGQVLVAGPDNTAEIYDPASGIFAPTGNMQVFQGGLLTATLTNDGQVLIVGGVIVPQAAELYDPGTGTFAYTPGAPRLLHGGGHTATLLNDGRVLVVGGLAAAGNMFTANSGAEIYNPTTHRFTLAAPMAVNRNNHTATLLQDGRVLITGGISNGFNVAPDSDNQVTGTAEIYDPTTNIFSTTNMQVPRAMHFASLLSDGQVLVGGGGGSEQSAELFNPATDSFKFTGNLNTPRTNTGATLLSSGQVLISGGYPNFPEGTSSAELYNPALGTFTVTGSMVYPRGNETATLLLDGRVLVTGGQQVCCSDTLPTAELYTPVIQGLVTSQTGITVRAAQGANSVPSQNVVVLSNTATIPFTVSTNTFSGGNWLSATPSSGTSAPGSETSLSINVNLAGLSAQDYYGTVTLSPTDQTHPPVSVSVVLNIVPAGAAAPPGVAPSALVFLGVAGSSPVAQTFSISNVTSKPISFTASGSATPNWFGFNPMSGNIGPGQSAPITVTPSSSGLTAGVYPGSIQVTFPDGSTQIVDLLLVIASSGSFTKPAERPRASGCTPSKLLPEFTSLVNGFTTPVAWPTSIEVQVVDDCANLINAGSATVSFSDGDPPLSLLAIGNGNWTATWVPTTNASSSFAVRVDVQSQQLTGSMQVTGQSASNPNVPIVSSVVSSGDYSSPPAQGLLVSIFGTALADGKAGASSLPLPGQLGSTSVMVSATRLPLLYVSAGQINVLVPYSLALNAPHQLLVLRGSASSVPAPIAVFDSEPAILATNGSGSGQGAIFKVDAQGNSVLADANNPASAGDLLVLYCVGLGAVEPTVTAGDAAPGNPPSKATELVTVSIGGQPATVQFAGLSPGSAGLYQVNATVPSGIPPGAQISVTVSVEGKSSSGKIGIGIK